MNTNDCAFDITGRYLGDGSFVGYKILSKCVDGFDRNMKSITVMNGLFGTKVDGDGKVFILVNKRTGTNLIYMFHEHIRLGMKDFSIDILGVNIIVKMRKRIIGWRLNMTKA